MKVASFLLFSAVTVLADWTVIFYTEPECKGEVLDSHTVKSGPDATCRQAGEPINVARSAHVIEDFDARPRHRSGTREVLRFYDTARCSHSCWDRHVLGETDWQGCVTWPAAADGDVLLQSYGVVEVSTRDPGCFILSDGYCLLKHGDVLKYNGRSWIMQQVAAAYFREIPAADWDDSIHSPNITHRLAEHGDVDIHGKYKYWQAEFEYMDRVKLEHWNETKHVKKEKHSRTADVLQSFVNELCMDAAEMGAGPERDEFIQQVPHMELLCSEKSFDEWKQLRQEPRSDAFDLRGEYVPTELRRVV